MQLGVWVGVLMLASIMPQFNLLSLSFHIFKMGIMARCVNASWQVAQSLPPRHCVINHAVIVVTRSLYCLCFPCFQPWISPRERINDRRARRRFRWLYQCFLQKRKKEVELSLSFHPVSVFSGPPGQAGSTGVSAASQDPALSLTPLPSRSLQRFLNLQEECGSQGKQPRKRREDGVCCWGRVS